jgi:hypothetical protein
MELSFFVSKLEKNILILRYHQQKHITTIRPGIIGVIQTGVPIIGLAVRDASENPPNPTCTSF